jgi:hypothetical protein
MCILLLPSPDPRCLLPRVQLKLPRSKSDQIAFNNMAYSVSKGGVEGEESRERGKAMLPGGALILVVICLMGHFPTLPRYVCAPATQWLRRPGACALLSRPARLSRKQDWLR